MSAAPQLPPDYYDQEPPRQPSPPPARKAVLGRVLAWALGLIAFVLVLVAVGVTVLLHSGRFHQYVLRKAREKATAAAGTKVAIRDYSLKFAVISPTVDLYGVTVAGAAPFPDPPLLQVEHATVGVRVVSLLHRSWYFSDVEVHRPIVHVFVDQGGQDNLPHSNKKSTGNNPNLFAVAIQHALLDGGELYYNNKKSALNADLHQLEFRSSFDAAARRYSGTLSYRNGRLQMEDFNPVEHDFACRFNATPERFTIEDAKLQSGETVVDLKATLDDYASPKVAATYNAVLDATELRRTLKNQTVPLGLVRLAGDLHYGAQPNVPALQVVTLTGTMSSSSLELRTSSARTTVRNLTARYSLQGGNAELHQLRAGLLGGELTGSLTVRDLVGASRSHLSASLRGAQLSAVKSLANLPALQNVSLSGGMDAKAEAAWGRTFADLIATADAAVKGAVAPAQTSAGASPAPLDGILHARYSAASQTVSLRDTVLHLPQTQLTLNGTLGDRSALQLHLQTRDLHQLESIAQALQKPAAGQPLPALGLYGAAVFDGTVRGSLSSPAVAGQFSATDLRLRGTEWRLLRAHVEAGSSNLSLQNGELDGIKRGRLRFDLRTALNHWVFTDHSQFNISANGSDLQVAELAKAAGTEVPFSGTISADIKAHGTKTDPFGTGTVTLADAKVSGESVQSAKVQFEATGTVVHASATVRIAAGTANAVLTYLPRQRTYDATLKTEGVRLEQLQVIKARGMNLVGALNLDASGHGSIDDPQLTATLRIPQLKIQDQTISGITLQTTVANHVAELALDSQALGSSLRGRGRVDLTGDYYTNATLDTQRIALQPLVALYAPTQAANVSGTTELHATIRGPLKDRNRLEVHAVLPVLALNYRDSVQIAAAAPVRIDLTNGVVRLQRTAIRGTDTDLQLQAAVPLASHAPPSLLALGTIDLRLAQLFYPDIVSSGQLRFDINSLGGGADQNVKGKIEVINATLATGTTPVGLEHGNGVLSLTGNRLEVTKLSGTVGGGTVSVAGGIIYRPFLQFDLVLTGSEIRMMLPPGIRAGVDTRLTLSGNMDSALLSGNINVNQVSFTPDFDLMSAMGQFGGTSSPPPAEGFANNVQLQLVVHSINGINLASRELSVEGTADLNLRGTAAAPVVLGRINLASGDLIFRGNRYVVEGGTIDFANPARTDPVLNLNASTTINQYNIAMRFEGPVDRMRTSYTADPALPPADIINLLAFGKTTEASAANPNPPGNLGAESVLASAVSEQVTSRLSKVAGISQLSIDPTLGGNQQNPGAVITIQQRVTGKIFVTFSTDVTGTNRQVIQLEYKKSPRVSFSATRDQNGGFAVDTKIHKNW